MELFTMSSYLSVKSDIYSNSLPTKRLDLGIKLRSCFFFLFFSFLFNLIFFKTNEVVQDWIKLIDLESRAEIKLIVILFIRSESMSFLS